VPGEGSICILALEAALAAQGFVTPTPIQEAVLLPAIRDRRDVIGAAQTGSGKTLAFGLPILQVSVEAAVSWVGSAGHGGAAGHISRSRWVNQLAVMSCPVLGWED